MFFKERAAASERYQWTTASERKCVTDIFFVCVAASRNISMFFDERAAASEKILKQLLLKSIKNVRPLLRIMST